MKKELTRRDVIKLAVPAGVGAVLLACDWSTVLRGLTTDPTTTPASGALATSNPVCARTETPTLTATAKCTPRPTETPKPLTTKEVSRISCEYVTNESLSRAVVFEGFPVKAVQVLTSSVDKMFKTANWNLSAALNLGFAEPGGLSNPAKTKVIDDTPYVIQTELQGWTKVFFQEGTLEWRGQDGKVRRVALPEKQGRTFGVYLREFFDTDGNKPVTVKVDCNVSEHGQTQHIDRPNTAFVSEGQLGQESASVFTGRNYNAQTGQFDIPNDNTARNEFTVVVVDMNTGAFTVATQKGLGQPFELENQNWK